MKRTKRLFLLLLVFSLMLSVLVAPTAHAHEIPKDEYNTVYMAVKDYGIITIELYPDKAPITVANFKDLVWHNFYDGLTFHRIEENFVIQGGDPNGNGTGGNTDAYGNKINITGEFAANGIENNIKHEAGTISMARSSSYNSASSQFFIVTQTTPENSRALDGNYAAFGKVTEGMDVVHAIAAADTNSSSRPLRSVVIADIAFDKAQAEAALLTANTTTSDTTADTTSNTNTPKSSSRLWIWISLSVIIVAIIALTIMIPVLRDKSRAKKELAEREAKRQAAREAAAAEARKKYQKKRK